MSKLLKQVVLIGSSEWDALSAAVREADSAALKTALASLHPDDPINIQYTSGTTGFPKGATLSHRNILNNGFNVGELCGYTPEDRVCIPVPFYHCFGMTETSPVSTQTRVGDTLDQRVSTVGRVHPHLEIQLVDPATGEVVPRGTAGELCTRGYSVMLGYWNNPEKTAEAIDADGWMHTEDLAVMDEDGYLAITGRIKDMVIRGGENIYPREIEEFLYTRPDIVDAQVIGVPDEKYGEELMAWVQLRSGADELTVEALREFATGKLARYKIPRYLHIADEFPMTVTGKIRKVEMRDQAVRLLGLE